MLNKLSQFLFGWFVYVLSDKQVERCYVYTGRIFGDALSYIAYGKCAGFDRMERRWAQWEKEYARRGYRTIDIKDFVGYGGYGQELTGLGIQREHGEALRLYAEDE